MRVKIEIRTLQDNEIKIISNCYIDNIDDYMDGFTHAYKMQRKHFKILVTNQDTKEIILNYCSNSSI